MKVFRVHRFRSSTNFAHKSKYQKCGFLSIILFKLMIIFSFQATQAGEIRPDLSASDELIQSLSGDLAHTDPSLFFNPNGNSSRKSRPIKTNEPNTKKFLYIRTVFSDFPNEPISANDLWLTVNGDVTQWIEDFSGGREKIVGDILNFTVQVPEPLSHYQEGDFTKQLMDDSLAAVAAQGVLLGIYDVLVVCIAKVDMEESDWIWAGLASNNTQIIREYDPHVFVHETIHNFGPGHSSSLIPEDGEIISEDAELLEYGSPWDVMGSGRDDFSYPNPILLEKAQWIHPSEILKIQENGIFRLYPFDQFVPNKPRALKIEGGELPIWVAARNTVRNDDYVGNGPLIYQQPLATRSILLDTRPNSNLGIADAALDIGRSFIEPEGEFFITPVARGTEEDGQPYYDISIQFEAEGEEPTPPTGSVDGPMKVQARSFHPYQFVPDSEDNKPGIVRWIFQDESLSRTGDSIQKSWNKSGNYSFDVESNGLLGNLATNKYDVIVEDFLDDFVKVDVLTDRILMDAEFGNDTFVIVGNEIRYSENGKDFSSVFSGGFFPDVDFDGNQFVAAGQLYDFDTSKWAYGVMSSADGKTWTRTIVGDGRFDVTSKRFVQIEKAGDVWMAITGPEVIVENGEQVVIPAQTWTSPDALTWTMIGDMTPTFRIESMVWAFDALWAVSTSGVLAKSTDGIQFEIVENSSQYSFTSIQFGNDTLIAMGADNALISTDRGENFEKFVPLGPDNFGQLRGVGHLRFMDGVFIGIHSDFINNSHFQYLSSFDGIHWEFVGKPVDSKIRGFAISDLGYLSVGDVGAAFFSSSQPDDPEPQFNFDSWIKQFYPDSEDPNVIGLFADPDNDKILNIAEYTHGTLPNDSLSTPVITQKLSSDSNGIEFTFSANPMVNDTQVDIQISNNLVQWDSPEESEINLTINSVSPEEESRTLTISRSQPDAWFVRFIYKSIPPPLEP